MDICSWKLAGRAWREPRRKGAWWRSLKSPTRLNSVVLSDGMRAEAWREAIDNHRWKAAVALSHSQKRNLNGSIYEESSACKLGRLHLVESGKCMGCRRVDFLYSPSRCVNGSFTSIRADCLRDRLGVMAGRSEREAVFKHTCWTAPGSPRRLSSCGASRRACRLACSRCLSSEKKHFRSWHEQLVCCAPRTESTRKAGLSIVAW